MSAGKVLLLIAVIVIVWYGFRWLQRSGLRVTVEHRGRARRRAEARRVLDLERNPATGNYEPRRDDAPR